MTFAASSAAQGRVDLSKYSNSCSFSIHLFADMSSLRWINLFFSLVLISMILSVKKYSQIALIEPNKFKHTKLWIKTILQTFFKSEDPVYFNTISETYFPIAKEDVNPGLSMPKRFIKPCKPWSSEVCIWKSAAFSEGP